jgi:hypothetical protein
MRGHNFTGLIIIHLYHLFPKEAMMNERKPLVQRLEVCVSTRHEQIPPCDSLSHTASLFPPSPPLKERKRKKKKKRQTPVFSLRPTKFLTPENITNNSKENEND